jgi:hypothetical protein
VASIIERIDLGGASNLMRVLIILTAAPKGVSKVSYLWLLGSKATIRYNHLPGNK